ncbi:MAG: Gfo/Idh/MocA family oxidoreductase [Bacillota bacterium]|nr:Gfo/Idh/MocA family oxidoreductase [Bacillota bacterium]
MSQKARIGIIGCGGMANSVHLPSLSEIENCEIIAVCDLVEEKVNRAAEKYNVPKRYTDHLEMLKSESFDGVVCLVEPDRMYRVVYDCLNAGVHVMMEKPAGINAYQSDSLARTAEKTGKILAVAMNRRHIPLVQHVFKKMKELTPITQVDGVFIKSSDIASGWHYMNAFVSDIIHAVDLIRYLAGSEPEAAATVAARNNSPIDNAWSSVIRFKNGITGTLKSNYQTAGRVHSFEIHGPKASAFINLGFGEAACEATILHASGQSIYSLASVGVSGPNCEKIDGMAMVNSDKYYQYSGFKQENIDFINCILSGQDPLCPIADAAKSMHMAEMLLEKTI